MEAAFEHRCMVTEAMLREYFKKSHRAMRIFGIVLTVLVGVIDVLSLLSLFVSSVLMEVLWPRLVAMTVAIVLFWLIVCFSEKISIWKTARPFGGKLPDSVVLFGECMQTNGPQGMVSYEYSQIRKVYLLSGSIALQLKKMQVILLTYDGFTKGTSQEFKQFLRQVRPDLTIPE